jgi:hypothetical protein
MRDEKKIKLEFQRRFDEVVAKFLSFLKWVSQFPPEKKTPIRIHRRQYPLTPAYAFTDQKAQCQTLEPVIVDIGQVPGNFGISPFAVYVALSRGRGRESIRLLRDFEDSLLTRYPSEAPRVEDDRLNMLRRITKEKMGRRIL